jgi:hypothetical protein
MCYGMHCKYEHSYTGECILAKGVIPPDAACMDGEDEMEEDWLDKLFDTIRERGKDDC